MDDQSKCGRLLRNGADVILLGLVGIVVLLVQLLGQPTVRGYYCDDDSIKYPYHGNTVTNLVLTLTVFLVPLLVVGVLELTGDNAWKPDANCTHCARLPKGVVKASKRYGVYLFGIGVTDVIVQMGKFTIGRLRPHFLAVCKPLEECMSTGYVTEYTCTGDLGMIEEARKSFPSGHSAVSFYAAVYLMMYLQCAFRWRSPKLACHLLQVLALIAAWFTALSRVTDNFHHWSDVLVGMLIGTIVAVLNVSFVSDLRLRCPTCRAQDNELLMHET